MARATVSLPVPGSPMIRIGRRLRAALAATAKAARYAGDEPTSWSSESSGASFSETGTSSPAGLRRSALAASASTSRSGATGLVRKSVAPARIALTASATESPLAATMTGSPARLERRAAMLAGPDCSSQLASSAAWTSRPCGPCSRPTAVSMQSAPTVIQPARAATADTSRRSAGSASTRSRDFVSCSRIGLPAQVLR